MADARESSNRQPNINISNSNEAQELQPSQSGASTRKEHVPSWIEQLVQGTEQSSSSVNPEKLLLDAADTLERLQASPSGRVTFLRAPGAQLRKGRTKGSMPGDEEGMTPSAPPERGRVQSVADLVRQSTPFRHSNEPVESSQSGVNTFQRAPGAQLPNQPPRGLLDTPRNHSASRDHTFRTNTQSNPPLNTSLSGLGTFQHPQGLQSQPVSQGGITEHVGNRRASSEQALLRSGTQSMQSNALSMASRSETGAIQHPLDFASQPSGYNYGVQQPWRGNFLYGNNYGFKPSSGFPSHPVGNKGAAYPGPFNTGTLGNLPGEGALLGEGMHDRPTSDFLGASSSEMAFPPVPRANMPKTNGHDRDLTNPQFLSPHSAPMNQETLFPVGAHHGQINGYVPDPPQPYEPSQIAPYGNAPSYIASQPYPQRQAQEANPSQRARVSLPPNGRGQATNQLAKSRTDMRKQAVGTQSSNFPGDSRSRLFTFGNGRGSPEANARSLGLPYRLERGSPGAVRTITPSEISARKQYRGEQAERPTGGLENRLRNIEQNKTSQLGVNPIPFPPAPLPLTSRQGATQSSEDPGNEQVMEEAMRPDEFHSLRLLGPPISNQTSPSVNPASFLISPPYSRTSTRTPSSVGLRSVENLNNTEATPKVEEENGGNSQIPRAVERLNIKEATPKVEEENGGSFRTEPRRGSPDSQTRPWPAAVAHPPTSSRSRGGVQRLEDRPLTNADRLELKHSEATLSEGNPSVHTVSGLLPPQLPSLDSSSWPSLGESNSLGKKGKPKQELKQEPRQESTPELKNEAKSGPKPGLGPDPGSGLTVYNAQIDDSRVDWNTILGFQPMYCKFEQNANPKPNSYFAANGSAPLAKEKDSLAKLFEKYREPTDEEDKTGVNGTMKYLQDLGLNLESAEILVPLEIVQAPALAEMSKDAFVDGWKNVGADTIPKQKAYVAGQLKQLSTDMALFKRVYRHTFVCSRETGQKALPLDNALVYWEMIFNSPGKPWITATTNWADLWIEFLKANWTKTVNKDMWNQTFEFFQKTMQDETLSFWSEDGAWPGVIDEFVAYVKEKRGDSPDTMETD